MSLARLHFSERPVASKACLSAVYAEVGAIHQYPDPECTALVQAIAERWGVQPRNVVVANGSDELLLLSALSLGDPSRPGMTTLGTFEGYRLALEIARRGCVEVPPAGRVEISAVTTAIQEAGIAFICTPHNPGGAALTHDELGRLVEAAAMAGAALVVDEAYMEFAPVGTASVTSLVASRPGVIGLRTFSKAYGLAGLRVGYALGHEADMRRLRSAQRAVPFSVNRLAQAAALAAIQDLECIERARDHNAAKRSWFTARLRSEGFEVANSAADFVAVGVADSAAVAQILLDDHGIAVRDTSTMGYPGHLRISLGAQDELELAIRALREARREMPQGLTGSSVLPPR